MAATYQQDLYQNPHGVKTGEKVALPGEDVALCNS